MTSSVPGLGWPEDAAVPPGASAGPQDPDSGDDAWVRQLAGVAEDAGKGRAVRGRRGASQGRQNRGLPGSYARRADRIGLGWPTPPDSADAGAGDQAVTAVDVSGSDAGSGPGEAVDEVHGPQRAGEGVPGLGAPTEAADAPAPVRVRQALASVSRETGQLTAAGPASDVRQGAGGPGGRGSSEGRGVSEGRAVPPTGWGHSAGERESAGGRPLADGAEQMSESEDLVVIPAVPATSADTPIARAAQAAVVARSGGEIWPRPSSCRIITIANQKGGVGKTTTAVNVAASLAMHGARVLVVDLDPQGNASTALDVDHRSGVPSVYNVLVDGDPLGSVVRPVAGFSHLYCAPAAIDLAGAEIELVPLVAREARLARAVAAYDSSNLDYIFIDCPPSLGLLTVNALVAAPEVLIPIQCEYYALEGLEQLLRTVELVRSHLNPTLAVTTILLTMYDGRTRLASQVADEVRDHFGAVVLGSVIPRSVRVSEAPSYGQSVMTYDPGSTGAQAYLEAARELARRNVQQPAS